MFGWFSKREESSKIEEETKKGFEAVKKDITAVTGWIRHLDSEKNLLKKELDDIKDVLSTTQEELEGIRNIVSIMNSPKTNTLFKTDKQLLGKQTAVYGVQTAVQTAVQTLNLNQFSVTERAIIGILLHSEMHLSYEDLAAMLGKEKSTIRGQINSIRQKSEGLIEELIEKNGKKRVFIPEEMKEKVLKKSKVRVKIREGTQKKREKDQEN
jgi:hypothetical protein